MTSTCTIRAKATGERTTAADGTVTFPVGAVVYSGKCRFRPASGPGGDSTVRDVGGVEAFTFDYLVSVPFSASGVREGHRVTCDSSPDPALVGVEVEVQHVDRGEHITARRLQCTEVA